jgi:hypothetical protein
MLYGRDNGGFLKRITWLEREIDTRADNAEIVVGAVHNLLKRIQPRSLLSAQDRQDDQRPALADAEPVETPAPCIRVIRVIRG